VPPRETVNVAGTRAPPDPPAGLLAFVPCDPDPPGERPPRVEGAGLTPPDRDPVLAVRAGAVALVLAVAVAVLAGAVALFLAVAVAVLAAGALTVLDVLAAVELVEPVEECLDPPQAAIAAAVAMAAQI
jgi:hypothetical protein